MILFIDEYQSVSHYGYFKNTFLIPDSATHHYHFKFTFSRIQHTINFQSLNKNQHRIYTLVKPVDLLSLIYIFFMIM